MPLVPHRYGVLVARIVAGQFRQQFGVHVLEVRHLRAGQWGEGTGLDQRGQTEVAGHHHVVAAAAGEQLAFEHFGTVEGVVDRRDPGVSLEVLQGRGADVVIPVVHVHGRGFDGKR
jgi:hypothetical protein